MFDKNIRIRIVQIEIHGTREMIIVESTVNVYGEWIIRKMEVHRNNSQKQYYTIKNWIIDVIEMIKLKWFNMN